MTRPSIRLAAPAHRHDRLREPAPGTAPVHVPAPGLMASSAQAASSAHAPDVVRQRGMAVIAALLVVAAAAAIAAAMVDRQAVQARVMRGEQARVQARWLLLGGVDWARAILRADGRRSGTTRGDQAWATPIVDLRISQDGDSDAARFSGRIEDEQGKFNLQNLARGGLPDPVQVAAFGRLLQALGLPAGAAPAVAQRMADSQARPASGAGTPGAAAAPGVPGTATAPGLRSVADLRGLAGLDAAAVQRLACCATVLPLRTPVNVNTAPPEVLHAAVTGLSLAQAAAMAGERDRGRYFNDGADFVNRTGDPELRPPTDALAADSSWFGLSGVVRRDGAMVVLQALLRRDDQQDTRLVWIGEPN